MKPKPKRKLKRTRIHRIKNPKFHYKTKCTVKGCKASLKRGDDIWSFSIHDKPQLGIVGRCKKHLKRKFDGQETNRASKDRSPR